MSTTVSLAGALEQKISIKLKDATIKEFLLELNKQNKFDIVYSNNDIPKEKRITANYDNTDISVILDECLKNSTLLYKIENNSIIIYKQGAVEPQQRPKVTIAGVVTGEDNKPVVGATIIVLKTSKGAISDEKGKFAIFEALGTEVEVSCVGFKTQKLKLASAQMIIKLVAEVVAVNDVIVTGYGKVRKESFTGNATTVTKENLIKANNKNVIAALQVFDPSFRIKENSAWGSDPNALPEFNIRGESSIGMRKGLDVEQAKRSQRVGLQDNPNLPIFILDGFEVSVQKIYDMDINRIESMTILKDAAATAMYGSRAANGVVVVTSVAPKPGELNVTYNFSGGATFPDLSDYNLCNAIEKLEVEKGAGVYTANDPALQVYKDQEYNEVLNQIKRGVNTDWLAIPLRNVFNHTHSFNVQGGVKSIRYGIDANYDSNKGAMRGSYRSRLGAGLSLDFYHREWLQLSNNVSFSNTKAEDSPYGDFGLYAKLQPYYAIYNDKGELMPKLINGVENPLWKVKNLDSYLGRNSLLDITNNFSLNLFFNKDFSFKGQFGLIKTYSDTESFRDPKEPNFSAVAAKEKGSLSLKSKDNFNWNVNAMFYYNKQINKHFINATLGTNLRETNDLTGNSEFIGYQLGALNRPIYAADQPNKSSYASTQSRLIGVFMSLNYSLDNIYLLDASFRMDGSSQFGEKNRMAPFWSVGVGLNVHNYKWLKDNSVISNLKFRGTYGVTGNVNFPSYSAVTTYAVSSDSWYYTGPAASLIYLGNPSLTWETTRTLDVGFSFGLFDNSITLDANYYNKQTVDLLDEVSIRASSGFNKYYSNSGSIRNRGYEVKLNARVFRNKDWTVVLNANMNANQNRITGLGKEMEEYNRRLKENYNSKTPDYPSLTSTPLIQYYVGASTTAIYAVPSYGIDPSNGKEKFKKKNGTNTYVWDAEDQVVIGDSSPSAQGSMSINIGYKGFHLATSLLYQWGGQTYNETLLNKVENAMIKSDNVDKRVLSERWKKVGDLTPYYDLQNNSRTNPTSRFVQDYNFLSLNSISCGYDFTTKFANRLKLTSLGVTFNANEVCRWSSVKEERGTSYPYAKNYSFTVKIGF